METSIQEIQLAQIVPSTTNPRKTFNEETLKDLAASITQFGVLSPVLLRPIEAKGKAKYELVFGERRFRAATLAGLSVVPANVRQLTDKEVLEIQVIENLQREDISPIEEAEGYDRLIKLHGYTRDTLAAQVHKSRSYIDKRLQLMKLCDSVKAKMHSGEVSLTHAHILTRVEDPELQYKALANLWNNNQIPTPAALNSYIEDHCMRKLKDAPFDLSDAILYPEAGACTTCPKNSENTQELFESASKTAQCGDPTCYKQKIDAALQRTEAEAKERGHEFISKSKAKKIFDRYSYSSDAGRGIRTDAGYVEASAKCIDHPEKATYTKIVGKAFKPIIAIDEDYKVRKLYRTDDIRELIKDEKWFKKIEQRASKPSAVETEADRQERARQNRISNRVNSLRFEKVMAGIADTPLEERFFFDALLQEVDPFDFCLLMKFDTEEMSRANAQNVIRGQYDRLSKAKRTILFQQLFAFGMLSAFDFGNGEEVLFKTYKITDAKLQKEAERLVNAEMKAEAKAEKVPIVKNIDAPEVSAESLAHAYSADIFPKVRKVLTWKDKLYVCLSILMGKGRSTYTLHPVTLVPGDTQTGHARGKGFEGAVCEYKLDRFVVGADSECLKFTVDDGFMLPPTDPSVKSGTCRLCGCTDDNACQGGCSWVEADLCSACAESQEEPVDEESDELLEVE